MDINYPHMTLAVHIFLITWASFLEVKPCFSLQQGFGGKARVQQVKVLDKRHDTCESGQVRSHSFKGRWALKFNVWTTTSRETKKKKNPKNLCCKIICCYNTCTSLHLMQVLCVFAFTVYATGKKCSLFNNRTQSTVTFLQLILVSLCYQPALD